MATGSATPRGDAADNLYHLLSRQFESRRTAVFLETENEQWSFAEVRATVDRLTRRLGEWGVGRGDRVAVQVEKSPYALCVYLACLRRGAIFVPLNTGYTSAELEFFLGDADPTLVLTDPTREAELRGLARQSDARVETLGRAGDGSLIDGLAEVEPTDAVERVDADAIAAILYTSGTTGRPKGAMLSHGNLSSNALALETAWGWQADDVLIHALPIFHIHGLFVALHCALLGGSRTHFLSGFDADTIVRRLPDATVLMGVPTFYTRLLDHPQLTPEQCASMRLFISGSAPLLTETFRQWEARTGHTILERYGMSETGMNISNPLIGERRPGSVGLPLPGVEARIVNRDGVAVTDDSVGMLQIRGPNVFRGYWQLPEKTREEFTEDGFFVTGDLATRAADGYYAIVGRDKDLVISGGYNVYPKEVEDVIDRLDGVRESAVIGIPDRDFGEAVTAIVVRERDADAVNESGLIAQARTRLAAYKVPKRVHFVDELPRNTMGKVQKNRLRERFGA